MFTYRCAACGKHHVMETPVEQPLQTKCLRCGAAISLMPEVMQQPQGRARTSGASAVLQDSITKRLSNKATGVASDGGSEAEVEAKTDQGASNSESGRNGKNRRKQPAEDEEGEGDMSRDKKFGSARRASKEAPKPETKETEDKPAEKPAWPKPTPAGAKTPPGKKGPRPRWKLIAAVAVVVLVIGGASGFLIFGGKKATPKQAAKASPPKSKPAPTPPPKKKVEPSPPPAPKTPPKVEFALSAPRLSDELAVNAAEANAVYAGKILEVSGLFARVEKKDGLRPSPRPHAVFATEGPTVCCDLQGSRTDLKTWNALPPDQPITVRGAYEKDGFLRDCFLMPYTPSADGQFKGKEIEVVGCVQEVLPPNEKQLFPAIKLEGDTNSTLGLLCFFRKTDAEEVQKIHRGSPVTIQGACSGRYLEEKRTCVRLDNCRLIYTSAPSGGTPRLDAARLLRIYEEDFHAFRMPPPGAEEQIQTLLSIKQVAEEIAGDPKLFKKMYRNRVISVVGTSHQAPKDQTLILQSADTDQVLKVQCRFGIQAFEGVDKRLEYRVRGLCTAMPDARTLILDNCELYDRAKKTTGPTLTADYLPHVPGKSIAYDIALFGVSRGKTTDDFVRREVHHQSAQGLTESLVTHTGPLIGKSLFDEDEQEKWIAAAKTKRIRVLTPGPVYYHRLSAGFVEVGDPEHGRDGKITIAWAPALKLGARAGAKWNWDAPSGEHDYVLEKFDKYRGRDSAAIRETIARAANISYPIEILHIYVKGLGEVERHAWMLINKRGNKRPLLEKKLVEPPGAGQGRNVGGGSGRVEPKDLK